MEFVYFYFILHRKKLQEKSIPRADKLIFEEFADEGGDEVFLGGVGLGDE